MTKRTNYANAGRIICAVGYLIIAAGLLWNDYLLLAGGMILAIPAVIVIGYIRELRKRNRSLEEQCATLAEDKADLERNSRIFRRQRDALNDQVDGLERSLHQVRENRQEVLAKLMRTRTAWRQEQAARSARETEIAGLKEALRRARAAGFAQDSSESGAAREAREEMGDPFGSRRRRDPFAGFKDHGNGTYSYTYEGDDPPDLSEILSQLFGGAFGFDGAAFGFGGARRGFRGFRFDSGGANPFGHGQPEGPQKDYYGILGIDKTASADDIKSAFRRRAMECHPDRNPGDKAKEAEFKEVNEAHEVLKDEHKRAFFDRWGVAPPSR
jgi:hypothetical protein